MSTALVVVLAVCALIFLVGVAVAPLRPDLDPDNYPEGGDS